MCRVYRTQDTARHFDGDALQCDSSYHFATNIYSCKKTDLVYIHSRHNTCGYRFHLDFHRHSFQNRGAKQFFPRTARLFAFYYGGVVLYRFDLSFDKEKQQKVDGDSSHCVFELCTAFGTYFPVRARIFCSTIGVALFIYYVFEILEQTKKDSLTGLLNRHAYHADTLKNPEDITALISIDMNGLKTINDTLGHAAGDEALLTLALCFRRALKSRQFGYRVGGDEFVIICRKTSQDEMMQLVERIEHNVGETKYDCALGYSYSADRKKPVEDMLRESDMMMYAVKERYYKERGAYRRQV